MELGADHIDVELQVPFFSLGANGAAGVPSLLALPPGCKSSDCIVRYTGELSVDVVTVLPQLRRVTSMELGCDPRCYSHAGNNTTVWYFAVLIGRQSTDSLKCVKVQDILSDGENVNQIDQHQAAMSSLKENRLTFAWVDSEAQKMTFVDRMAGANLPSLAAMEQTRMLAHTLAQNTNPKFQCLCARAAFQVWWYVLYRLESEKPIGCYNASVQELIVIDDLVSALVGIEGPYISINRVGGNDNSIIFNVDGSMDLALQGAANIKVAGTDMNNKSSRSHSVFTCWFSKIRNTNFFQTTEDLEFNWVIEGDGCKLDSGTLSLPTLEFNWVIEGDFGS
ncbi:unnamed protein product [Lactuca saligna]|uniref:Kinesin motor domain-containing protein n=1 Tax=Lactuca saligna TaxID=75948 RepID=A0AA35YEB3_LACSI|nr:unnamed protein product [Lactuca saligna]